MVTRACHRVSAGFSLVNQKIEVSSTRGVFDLMSYAVFSDSSSLKWTTSEM